MNYYKNNTNHWLYIGWENHYPKSLVFMGGALCPNKKWKPKYPDNAIMKSPLKKNIIQYGIIIDGEKYFPDEFSKEQRKTIDWKIYDNVYPCTYSSWKAGPLKMMFRHFCMKLSNKNAVVIFTSVQIVNKSKRNIKFDFIVNTSKSKHVPINIEPNLSNKSEMIFNSSIAKSKTISFEFVSNVDKNLKPRTLRILGNFKNNLVLLRNHYNTELNGIAKPAQLPNMALKDFYQNIQITLWYSLVKTKNGDIEIRGSGGNPHTFYQYDRTFSHDVPDMVNQMIKDGDFGRAKSIIESSYFQKLGMTLEQNYFDAIPKYIISYATYLQFSGDKDYFDKYLLKRLKIVSRMISKYRTRKNKKYFPSLYNSGIMKKSNTLDNGSDYLLVDNFAALHGLVSYRYICKSFSIRKEVEWATKELNDLNTCLNNTLNSVMIRRKTNYYMCAFDDKTKFWVNGYDGNWLGTSLMMSTFPWNASLKELECKGTWEKYFDNSIRACENLAKKSKHDIPNDSWGAWWGHEYGTVYNAGMSVQTLYSEKYRSKLINSIEFLIDNQSAPIQWGESFDKATDSNSWSIPATDLETWGLSFLKQAILEMCIAVKSNGEIIIGRGIPNKWMYEGSIIEWKSVPINNNERIDFKILIKNKVLFFQCSNRNQKAPITINISFFKNNLDMATTSDGRILRINKKKGTVHLPTNIDDAKIYFSKTVN